MAATPEVLVVDDEEDIRSLLALQLGREGLAIRLARTGVEALNLALARPPALVILDVMLPDLSGVEVCRSLRADPATSMIPVLMLTARDEEVDRVVGFEVGADDYVTKPFSTRELILRVRSLLRRSVVQADAPGERVRVGRLHMDLAQHRVWVDDEEVNLTVTEFNLLHLLASRVGRVQTRGQLLEEVWDTRSDLDTRTVDTHVKRLREKLGAAGDRVETVRGVGYRLARPAPS